jgi:predicted ATPase
VEIHQRTEGNALFVVNIIAELLAQARIVQDSGNWRLHQDQTVLNIPDNVRQLIERQLERLSEEAQEILEGASVAGSEFAVAAVAAGLKHDAESVEEICEDLAWQGHFVSEVGLAEWPDGTVSGKYAFRHTLYQNVLYERIAEARRVRLHRLIGERSETGYKEQTREIAAELAVHCERGRDYQRAVHYLQHAGKNALARSANREAISYFTKGLELLKALPDAPERTQHELTLQLTLGVPLQDTKGYGAPEVEQTYSRALALCRKIGETPLLFSALGGLHNVYMAQREYHKARAQAEQLLRLAENVHNLALLMTWHTALAMALYYLGELTAARIHCEQGLAGHDPHQPFPISVPCLSYLSQVLWDLAIRTKLWVESRRPWRWRDSYRFPSSWGMPCSLLPRSITNAGRSKQPRSRQRRL